MRTEWLYDRILRAPENGDGAGGSGGSAAGDEGEGQEGAASGSSPAAKGTPDRTNKPAPKQEPNPALQTKIERPGWMPEKLWGDGEKFIKDGKLNGDAAAAALTESYKNLETKLHTRTDDLKRQVREEFMAERAEGVPEKPDGYKVEVSEDFKKKVPEGYEVAIDEKGPLFSFVKEFAHHHKIPQADVSKLVEAYIDARMSEFPDFQEERKKLGENADQRLDTVNGWLKKHLSAESYAVVEGMAVQAEVIAMFEELMELGGTPKVKPNTVGKTGDQAPTREELQRMQADPRYSGTNPDPAFVQKVKAGFKRLAETRR